MPHPFSYLRHGYYTINMSSAVKQIRKIITTVHARDHPDHYDDEKAYGVLFRLCLSKNLVEIYEHGLGVGVQSWSWRVVRYGSGVRSQGLEWRQVF